MKKYTWILLALPLFLVSACESKTENAVEDVGEAIENAAEDVEDTAKDAAEEVKEAVEK